MSLGKKNVKHYYDEVQELLAKYPTGHGQVDWLSVCLNLFNRENPVVPEQDLKDDCADYSGRSTENSAWTFSIHMTAWLLYNLKSKTQVTARVLIMDMVR
jgi:hypothetical protein